jgi:uncharacterized protein YeaO (DUF488 family)
MKQARIEVARAYDTLGPEGDGARFLVDRMWPRGVTKESLHLDAWLRDVAPSTELRRWFAHDPARWEAFIERYCAELDANPSAWQPIADAAKHGRVTLLFGARDREHNQAVVLRDYLARKLAHH